MRALRRMQACLALSLFGLPRALVEVDEATEGNLSVWVVYPQCLLSSSQYSLMYNSSTFSYCLWLRNAIAILLTVVRVSGWSTPNAFSPPANARS